MIKDKKFTIRYLPLPPITKAYQIYYDVRLYKNEACNKLQKYWSDEKHMYINLYQSKREALQKKSNSNASLVNMSIMFESALEATFQERLMMLRICFSF